MTIQEAENFIALIEVLREADEATKKMSEQEKKDNAIKMGDICY